MNRPRCPVCQTPTDPVRVLDADDAVSGERFAIVRCPRCGVMRTIPVPADLGPYYDSDIGRLMKDRPTPIHTTLKAILLSRELRRLPAGAEAGPILDIGCGSGDLAYAAFRRGQPVIAADVAAERPVMIRDIAAIPYHRIDFERCDIDGLKPLRACTVVLRHVLEHLRDPRAFLRRLADYGMAHAYVVVPNVDCLERRLLGTYWYAWDPPRHLWHFDAGSLRTMLAVAELRVVDWGYDTIPNLIPSLYRYLRLRGWPPALYGLFSPKGTLSSLSTPLNLLLPRNVLWALAAVER